MPRKVYIADLKQLSSSSANDIDGISNIRSGDDDGEIRFSVSGDGSQYEISALIPGKRYVLELLLYPTQRREPKSSTAIKRFTAKGHTLHIWVLLNSN
jgi:hypothetical protein